MEKSLVAICVIACSFAARSLGDERTGKCRRLPVREYVDRMKAGWIGQMVGVGWGGPTEFKWRGEIIPADKLPQWEPGMVNQFGQDDLYVEMTWLDALERYGLDITCTQAGKAFADSTYGLAEANNTGRENVRHGIMPPLSGHPKHNRHADDIDFQIESDVFGIIRINHQRAFRFIGLLLRVFFNQIQISLE